MVRSNKRVIPRDDITVSGERKHAGRGGGHGVMKGFPVPQRSRQPLVPVGPRAAREGWAC